jgi:hypothetical protein
MKMGKGNDSRSMDGDTMSIDTINKLPFVVFLGLMSLACASNGPMGENGDPETSDGQELDEDTGIDPYESDRKAIADKLRNCGELTEGYFWWEENTREGDDPCWLGCVELMACSDLALMLCFGGTYALTLDKKNAFQECVDSCDGAQECIDSTAIIPAGWVCDGIVDCLDYSDEIGMCPIFTCADGEEIPIAWVCDAELDCSTGEDELNCSALTCGDAGGNFYPVVTRCDGKPHCENLTDEMGCGLLTQCPDREWAAWHP